MYVQCTVRARHFSASNGKWLAEEEERIKATSQCSPDKLRDMAARFNAIEGKMAIRQNGGLEMVPTFMYSY